METDTFHIFEEYEKLELLLLGNQDKINVTNIEVCAKHGGV